MEENELSEQSLSYTAQMMSHFFYGDVKSSDDFFELEHFIFCARAVFAKLLQTEANSGRNEAKIDSGYATINLSQEWLISEIVEFKNTVKTEFEATLKQKPFYFINDGMGYGIQSVEDQDRETVYNRISPDQKWELRHMPQTNCVFWFPRGQKIIALNESNCTPKQAEVWYAPSLSGDPDKELVPLGKQAEIVEMGVMIIKKLEQGVIVDMTNNQNTNKIIQSEIDKTTLGK